jgi:hypothetical protein
LSQPQKIFQRRSSFSMAESAKELEQVERFGSQAMQEEWLGVMSAKAKLTLIVVRALVMIMYVLLFSAQHVHPD